MALADDRLRGQDHGLADSCRVDCDDHCRNGRFDYVYRGSQFQKVSGTPEDRDESEEHEMPKRAKKYGILVAVDGSPESDAAVRWAAQEAEFRDLPITLA